ncbi:hypothetical protein AAHA92_13420 [Salvia divinorum]|uniref:Uncharacterized protein n=1 Tax=Salvia divinorum TaxID=28513 RepID=A0ABD1H874_SALDI
MIGHAIWGKGIQTRAKNAEIIDKHHIERRPQLSFFHVSCSFSLLPELNLHRSNLLVLLPPPGHNFYFIE